MEQHITVHPYRLPEKALSTEQEMALDGHILPMPTNAHGKVLSTNVKAKLRCNVFSVPWHPLGILAFEHIAFKRKIK